MVIQVQCDVVTYLGSNLRPKVILVWRPFFGVAIDNQEACPGCILTHDHSATGIADALVFHCTDLSDSKSYLPTNLRSPWQRYVWLCMEPPSNVRFTFQKVLAEMDDVFNWTMTYRTDSDILMSYTIPWGAVNKTTNELIKLKDASELVSWAVSNCFSKPRMEYANELAKHVPVDYYGACFGKKEGLNIKRYKFYLAFENSHCKDYISEKFWVQALSNFAVPIVMGTTRGDYEKVAPPNSFIHVDDFHTPKDLAEYLLKLDSDDKLYGEYLRWRSLLDNKGLDWKSDVSVNPKLQDRAYKNLCMYFGWIFYVWKFCSYHG